MELLCYLNDPITELTNGIKKYSFKYIEERYNPNLMFDKVHLISFYGDENKKFNDFNTLRFYTVNTKHKFLKPIEALRIGLKITKQNQIDIVRNKNVHEFGMLGTIISVFRNIPLVQSIHDDYDKRFNPHHNYIQYLAKHILETINIKSADKVIAISDFIAEYAKRHGANDIVQIPNPVDVRRFQSIGMIKAKELKFSLGIKHDDIVLLFVGRYSDPQKNFERLLKAVASLPEHRLSGLTLVVVGGTRTEAETQYYDDLVNKLNIKKIVKFVGSVSYDDIPVYYNMADFLVHPTLFEGFGYVFVEAMASGLPILTSNHPVPTQFVDQNNGVVVDPYSIKSIKSGIEYLLPLDDEQRRWMTEISYIRSMEYDERKVWDKEIQLYKEVI